MNSIVGTTRSFSSKLISVKEKVGNIYKNLSEKFNIFCAFVAKKIPVPVFVIIDKFSSQDLPVLGLTMFAGWFLVYCAPYKFAITLSFFLGILLFGVGVLREYFKQAKTVYPKVEWIKLGFITRTMYEALNLLLLAIVLIFTIKVVPDSLEYQIYKPNVVTWIQEGKCDEIAHFSNNTAQVCERYKLAKQNLGDTFVVKQKMLQEEFAACSYLLESKGGGQEFLLKDQSCDIKKDKQVELSMEIKYDDSFFSKGYYYTPVFKKS